jgi:DNA (cytosine-5)-methyltransferase 1
MTFAVTDTGSYSRVWLDSGRLVRELSVEGWMTRSQIPLEWGDTAADPGSFPDPLGAWWKACLSGATPVAEGGPPPTAEPGSGAASVRTVDLFAGAGGLMVGVGQLVAEAGRRLVCELAVDTDSDALRVHARNHGTRRVSASSVTSLVDYRIQGAGAGARFVYEPELLVDDLRADCSAVDLVAAGPPCQGHSNLNNHSRRSDPRNLLYLAVPAFAVACGAGAVVIENVTSVIHDRSQVVQAARALLESNGYLLTDGVLSADAMGWPQTRKRHFLIARRSEDGGPVPLAAVSDALAQPQARSVGWALGGGEALSADPALHEPTALTEANRLRIQWLFDHDEHDLALDERPECHQDGTSYGAVYGRLHGDRPAPTITTGFTTPGRGRFVHPSLPRTLTPAEAARLQGFPDTYVFRPEPDRPASRSQLAKWIGDAVAMPLGYAAAFSALAPGIVNPAG